MFGIKDPGIWSAYLICILSAIVCVVYGIVNWNKGDEGATSDDRAWAKEEDKVVDQL